MSNQKYRTWCVLLFMFTSASLTQAQDAGFSESDFAMSIVTLDDGDIDEDFLTAGEVWPSMSQISQSRCAALARDGENRIVWCGFVRRADRNVLWLSRYLQDGMPDSSFGDGGVVLFPIDGSNETEGRDVVIDPSDGSIVVCGSARVAGAPTLFVARFRSSGEIDPTFGGSEQAGVWLFPEDDPAIAETNANSLTIDGRGRYVVAGTAFLPGEGSVADRGLLLRLNRSGPEWLDADFGEEGVRITSEIPATVTALSVVRVDSREQIVAAGVVRGFLEDGDGESTESGAGEMLSLIVRYLPDASQLDQTFGDDGSGAIVRNFGSGSWSAASDMDTDGRAITVCGLNGLGFQESEWYVARYGPGGQPILTFGDAGVSRTGTWEEGMAHLPRLLHDRPGSAFVVASKVGDGIGVGRFAVADGDMTMKRIHESPTWRSRYVGGLALGPSNEHLWVGGSARVATRLPIAVRIPSMRFLLMEDWGDPLQDSGEEYLSELRGIAGLFHGRVQDLSDGQLAIDGFVFDLWQTEHWPVKHLPRTATCRLTRGAQPATSDIAVLTIGDMFALKGSLSSPKEYTEVYAHQSGDVGKLVAGWLTALIGMMPESTPYYSGTELIAFPSCPDGSLSSHASIMSDHTRKELCRAHVHSEETAQHQVHQKSCYEHLRDSFEDDASIIVPGFELLGPEEHPAHWVLVYRFDGSRPLLDDHLSLFDENGRDAIDQSVTGVLITKTGKRIHIGLSTNAERNDGNDAGHANGKVVLRAEGNDPVETIEIKFEHKWNGNKISSETVNEEYAFSPVGGDHQGAQVLEEVKKKSLYEVEALASDCLTSVWQYHVPLRYGHVLADISSHKAMIEIIVTDDGEVYTVPLDTLTILNWHVDVLDEIGDFFGDVFGW